VWRSPLAWASGTKAGVAKQPTESLVCVVSTAAGAATRTRRRALIWMLGTAADGVIETKGRGAVLGGLCERDGGGRCK